MDTGVSVAPTSRVATVVLNYRNVDDTLRCVRSLQESDFPDQRVVVVDNAEEGLTTAALRDQLESEVLVVASGDNLGYAGGNNFGITHALRWQPEFIWIVNPDAVAKPNTLSGLVRTAEEHPDAGIVGCRMLVGGSRPPRIESHGGSLEPEQWGAPRKRAVGRFDREVIENRVRDVDWVSGACFLFRVALIDDIGMLPEEYFLYFEDTEYCRRAQAAGWRTVVAPRTRMWHFGGSTRDLPSASSVYYLHRNQIHFGARHFDVTVDELVEHVDGLVRRKRTSIEQHAPELLETYDDLVRMALDDAKAGRFGRVKEIESIPFSPSETGASAQARRLTAVLERDRKIAARDATRLLDRLTETATALERERRLSERLQAQIDELRASRSFRFGRVMSRMVHPAATTRALLARRSQ